MIFRNCTDPCKVVFGLVMLIVIVRANHVYSALKVVYSNTKAHYNSDFLMI